MPVVTPTRHHARRGGERMRARPLALIPALALGAVLGAAALARAPVAHAAPATSFLWFPGSPHTGETVSFASISTDLTSPILAFSWDLQGDGRFAEGGPLASATFASPGEHLVRLRVSAADGSSSVAEEEIPVSSPVPEPMLPSPIVRIVGSATRSGTAVQLLSVEAPPGAQIALECHGGSCPVHYAVQSTRASGVGTATLGFRRLQKHTLKPGTVLEVRVSQSGRLGKYTRFVMRRGRAPARLDECLEPGGIAPTPCPA